jgi:hypothetical protein
VIDIGINFFSTSSQIDSLMASFRELPRHIARKHLKAAMNRTVKNGVPVLRSLTPKGTARNKRNAVSRDSGGRFLKGSGKKFRQRAGAMRRAVTSKSKFVGRAKDGFVVGVVGYRGGLESRKAIWLEYGTSRGISPRDIIPKFLNAYGKPQGKTLVREMKKALKAAARELASGKNPGRR